MGRIRILAVAFGCLLAVCGSSLARAGNTSDLSPETIAKHIYLGQLYPSGNIYLVAFPFPSNSQSEYDYQKTFSWPQSISWHALFSASFFSGKTKVGHFSGVLHDTERGEVIYTAYIPGLEGMDDEHESCGSQKKFKKNPRYRYVEDPHQRDDFFFQVDDNCNMVEGTAVFKSDNPGILSYPVIAFDKQAPLSDIKQFNHKKRPLTTKEMAEVAKDKRWFARNKTECRTYPTYIDSAVVLVTAKVRGTDMTIRLSRYDTSGCGGHWADYYILDFLKGGKLIKKYELEHYIGGV